MKENLENIRIDIINTKHIEEINVYITEKNTKIELFSLHSKDDILLEEQDNRKYKEQIETLLLNTLNDKRFISISKVEKALVERIKQAKKVDTDYENKD